MQDCRVESPGNNPDDATTDRRMACEWVGREVKLRGKSDEEGDNERKREKERESSPRIVATNLIKP